MHRPPGAGAGWVAGVVAGLAAVAALAALFSASYARFRAGAERPEPAQRAAVSAERVPEARQSEAGRAPDELEARARRELDRLYRRTGVGEPPTAGDDVRLLGGGSLSRTDYERYRRGIGGAPR